MLDVRTSSTTYAVRTRRRRRPTHVVNGETVPSVRTRSIAVDRRRQRATAVDGRYERVLANTRRVYRQGEL